MKALFAVLALFLLPNAHAAAIDASRNIYCRIEAENGTSMLTIEPQHDGTFVVAEEKAGENVATSPDQLELHGLGLILCHGADLSLDLSTGRGEVAYKYDSGILGGGCQHTSGKVVGCNNQGWPQN